jgi:hypothetical protein
LTGHGSAFDPCVEFLDVAAAGTDGGGEFANDAGAVVAGDLDVDGLRRGGFLVVFTHRMDDEAGDAGVLDFSEKLVDGFGGAIDADNSGEVTRQADHAAFLPTAVVAGDDGGKRLDEPGAVRSEDGHDDGMVHGGNWSTGGGGIQSEAAGGCLFLAPSLCIRRGTLNLRQVISSMARNNPFLARFQTLAQLPTHHTDSVNRRAYRELHDLLSVPLDHPGRCVLLRAPRAGYGKTHLLARLRHALGASHEFVAVRPTGAGVVDANTMTEDVLRRLLRSLPAAGGMTVLDLLVRRLLAVSLQPLVRAGEVPCQNRDAALAALQMRPVETFDFHHPNAVTAHWARDNFAVLGPRLSLEVAHYTGLPVADAAFWLDAFFRFASSPLDYPARGHALVQSVRLAMAGGGFNVLVALLVILTRLTRVVVIADDLEGFSADQAAALRFGSLVGSLRQAVERLDVVLSVNQDVWKGAFVPGMSSGLEDRLSEVVIDLEPLNLASTMDLLESRVPGCAEEILREFSDGLLPDHARGLLQVVSLVWMRIEDSLTTRAAAPAVAPAAPVAVGVVRDEDFVEVPEEQKSGPGEVVSEDRIGEYEEFVLPPKEDVPGMVSDPPPTVEPLPVASPADEDQDTVDVLLRQFRERYGKGGA